MKKYIYMIETQKPTGASQFIKVLDDVLVVQKGTVDSKNTFAQVTFNDRVENYTYLGVVEKETWPELLNYFYCLVKQYDESLEYTRNEYVYLIPKRGREPGIRIGHRLPRKLDYSKVKPIPFYPEKKKSEEDEEINTSCDCRNLAAGLFDVKWYMMFYQTLSELQQYYMYYHSQTFIYFMAFVTTYWAYYTETQSIDKVFYFLQLADNPTALMPLQTTYCPDKEYYQIFIDSYMKRHEFWPSGAFFCNLKEEQLVELYRNFLKALQE